MTGEVNAFVQRVEVDQLGVSLGRDLGCGVRGHQPDGGLGARQRGLEVKPALKLGDR